LQEENKKLNQQIENITKQSDDRDAENKSLLSQIDDFKKQNQQLSEQVSDLTSEAQNRTKLEKDGRDAELKQYQTKIQNLEKEIETHKQNFDKLKKDAVTRIQDGTKKQKTLQEEKTKLKDQYSSIKRKHDEELQDKETQEDVLKAKIKKLNADVCYLQDTTKDQTGKIEIFKKQNNDLERKSNDLEKRNNDLERQKSNDEKAIAELQENVSSMSKTIDSLQSEMKTSSDTHEQIIYQLQQQLEQQQLQYSQQIQQLKQLHQQQQQSQQSQQQSSAEDIDTIIQREIMEIIQQSQQAMNEFAEECNLKIAEQNRIIDELELQNERLQVRLTAASQLMQLEHDASTVDDAEFKRRSADFPALKDLLTCDNAAEQIISEIAEKLELSPVEYNNNINSAKKQILNIIQELKETDFQQRLMHDKSEMLQHQISHLERRMKRQQDDLKRIAIGLKLLSQVDAISLNKDEMIPLQDKICKAVNAPPVLVFT
jgi:chromosome segregation ATPase